MPAFDQEDLEPYLYVESQTKKLPVCFKFCFFADKLLFKSHFVFGGEKYVSFLKSVANRFAVIKYQQELLQAVKFLADWNYQVSIFNVPLCLLPEFLHGYARKSISDWKKSYELICHDCRLKSDCCGFFTTSKRLFKGIKPFV